MRGNSMILLRSTGKKEIELNDATIKRPAAYGWVIAAYGILVAGASILLQGFAASVRQLYVLAALRAGPAEPL